MAVFDRDQRMIRRVIRLFSRNYMRMMKRYTDDYNLKRSSAIEVMIHSNHGRYKEAAQHSKKVIEAIVKQKTFLRDVEAEMELFTKTQRFRLIAWLNNLGAQALIPYIEKHGKMVEDMVYFLREHKMMPLLALQMKRLEEADYKGFTDVFIIELKFYKQIDKWMEKNFENIKGFFEYQFEKDMILEEEKPIFRSTFAEIDHVKTSRFPSVLKMVAATIAFFTLLVAAVPGQASRNVSKELPSIPRAERFLSSQEATHYNDIKLHFAPSSAKDLEGLKAECRGIIARIKSAKTPGVSTAEKNDLIIKFKDSIRELDSLLSTISGLQKAKAGRTLAQLRTMLQKFDEETDKVKARVATNKDAFTDTMMGLLLGS